MSANTVEENKKRHVFSESEQIWLFGYGSLIFKADFQYLERRPATLQGWERRFWQGSHDHRGTEEFPGRVVTLIARDDSVCHGMAYRITKDNLEHLDYREKNGYLRFFTNLCFDDQSTVDGLAYIARENNSAFLGPLPEADIARQIYSAKGPSGTNGDYLLKLADALRNLNASDEHVFSVEQHYHNLIG